MSDTPDDPAVTRILDDLRTELEGAEDVDDKLEALTRAHGQLQERLTNPTPPPPGEARPGGW